MRHSWKAMYQFDRDADRLEAEFTDQLAREVEASSSPAAALQHPLPVGTCLITVGGAAQGDWDMGVNEDEDDDAEEQERRTRPGEPGKIVSANHYDGQGWTYGVVFDECNAWVFVEEAEINNPAQYIITR